MLKPREAPMKITDVMLLPEDVMIIAAGELSEKVRSQCSCGDDDFVLSRPTSRSPSRVVNRGAAELLRLFREPKTIVEVALTLSDSLRENPDHTLEAVFGAVRPFIQTRWLVPANSTEAKGITTTYQPGEAAGPFTILNCVKLLEDTEVYQVRTEQGRVAALKVARRRVASDRPELFVHEARILRHLGAEPAPALLADGFLDDLPYLATAWCEGGAVSHVAAEMRQLYDLQESRRRLLELCCRVVEAFAALHDRGVLHGDVSPNNILINAQGAVRIIDYGSAHLLVPGAKNPSARRGVPEFYEPELAAALLANREDPPPSVPGELYALGALLYLLATGQPYLPFSATKNTMLRQIRDDRPLSFSENGVPAWPSLERVLGVALAKQQEERYATLSDFLRALQQAVPPGHAGAPGGPAPSEERGQALLRELAMVDVRTFQLPANMPQASLAYGAAGIGYALYAASCIRRDPLLLAGAEAWAERAVKSSGQSGAFEGEALGLSMGGDSRASLYFGLAGVHVVRALIAAAMGDKENFARSLEYFSATCVPIEAEKDVTLGRAGLLIGCSLLLKAARSLTWHEPPALEEKVLKLGHTVASTVWSDAEEQTIKTGDYLGIAHGWAGRCHASLLWSQTSGAACPANLRPFLDLLAGKAHRSGRGLRWPMAEGKGLSPEDYMESWCHGTPGYVYLFTLAARQFREPSFLQIAEQAAWTAWETPGTNGSLCCGFAGRAYALLHFHRQTGEVEWRRRAEKLSERAWSAFRLDSPLHYSLYKGRLGAAVLSEDMGHPELSSFPLFDEERR